jgi:uncharacterized protein YggE
MKRILLLIVGIVLLTTSVFAQQAEQSEKPRMITVSGEAVVKVVPDKIIITFGIETWAQDILEAKQENNKVVRNAMEVMKRHGVLEENMQTDYLAIEPRYDNSYRKEKFLGYFVRNTLAVTLTETGKFEQVLTDVLQAGVNYIHGVDFQTTELRKYRDQARELALKAAQEKAELMAATLGQKIGQPLQINEVTIGAPWWYSSSWWGYGRQAGMTQNVMQNAGGNQGETSDTLALGKISIRANVTVTFALQE